MESEWRLNVAREGWAGDEWDLMAQVSEGPWAGLWLRGRSAPVFFATLGETLFLADDRQVFVPVETYTGRGFPFGLPVYPD